MKMYEGGGLFLVSVLALTAPLWSTMTAQAQTVNVEAAKKEGKVVVYGVQMPQAMKKLHKNFEKKYDIKVKYWRGSSTQIAERALSEWRASRPGYDIVEGN